MPFGGALVKWDKVDHSQNIVPSLLCKPLLTEKSFRGYPGNEVLGCDGDKAELFISPSCVTAKSLGQTSHPKDQI